jgi:hypothetical protein
MRIRQPLIGRPKLLCCLLAVASLIGGSAAAEPDRLVRAYLGVSAIRVRFSPPADKKCCYLAVAKFEDGKFLGYADLLAPPVEYFGVSADRPNYEAELGWAEKDKKLGFFLTTPGGSQGFQADEFFRGLGATQFLALGKAPTQKLGPFSVLGFGFGGNGAPLEGAKPGEVRDVIRGKFRVAVFLMAPFDTLEQARDFGKTLPKLSTD